MPRYFFHLRDGTDILIDPEGRELQGAERIGQSALVEARSIISEDAREGRIVLDQRIDVEDEGRNVVYSLDFADAVEIVGPGRR